MGGWWAVGGGDQQSSCLLLLNRPAAVGSRELRVAHNKLARGKQPTCNLVTAQSVCVRVHVCVCLCGGWT